MKGKTKKTVRSFRLRTDVSTKLNIDAQMHNMETSEYLEYLIMKSEKPVYSQKDTVKALYNLTLKIQETEIAYEDKEEMLEEVKTLWRVLS